MSIVTNIFSALGNNSTLYPIIFKDTIDNAGRTAMAYKQGAKNGKEYGLYDARERLIDENVTSLVWIGGIPLLKLIYDKLVTNKIYKFSNFEQLGSTFDKKGTRAMADTNVKLLSDGVQTLEKNIELIEKSKDFANNKVLQNLVKNAKKISANKGKFQKIYAGNRAFSSLIPLLTIGFVLPRLIQKLTKSIYRDNKKIKEETAQKMVAKNFGNAPKVFTSFSGALSDKNDNKVNFKGKMGNLAIDLFNSNVANQAILDGGIFAGRVATGINIADKIEKGIKEIGVIFFIYLGGPIVGGILENLASKLGQPIALDSQILEDKAFQKQILEIANANPKQKKEMIEELCKFPEFKSESFRSLFKKESLNPDFKKLGLAQKVKAVKTKLAKINVKNETQVIDFIDQQVKNGVSKTAIEKAGKTTTDYAFKNGTLKIAQKLGVVDLIEGVKNPLQYINTKKVGSLNSSLKEFVTKAVEKGSPQEVEKFLKKSLVTKRASIILNLAICTIATAYTLPKLQYKFREKFTKSSNLPALATYEEEINAEKKKIA